MKLNATEEEKNTVKKTMAAAKLMGINKSFNEHLILLRKIRSNNDDSLAKIGFKRIQNHDGIAEFHKTD